MDYKMGINSPCAYEIALFDLLAKRGERSHQDGRNDQLIHIVPE